MSETPDPTEAVMSMQLALASGDIKRAVESGKVAPERLEELLKEILAQLGPEQRAAVLRQIEGG